MPLKYAFPGGKIEEGETPEEAASRELYEETEIEVSPNLLKKIATVTNDDYVNFVHVAEINNKKVILNFEHDKYVWCNFEDCSSLNLVPGLLNIIEMIKNKGYFER